MGAMHNSNHQQCWCDAGVRGKKGVRKSVQVRTELTRTLKRYKGGEKMDLKRGSDVSSPNGLQSVWRNQGSSGIEKRHDVMIVSRKVHGQTIKETEKQRQRETSYGSGDPVLGSVRRCCHQNAQRARRKRQDPSLLQIRAPHIRWESVRGWSARGGGGGVAWGGGGGGGGGGGPGVVENVCVQYGKTIPVQITGGGRTSHRPCDKFNSQSWDSTDCGAHKQGKENFRPLTLTVYFRKIPRKNVVQEFEGQERTPVRMVDSSRRRCGVHRLIRQNDQALSRFRVVTRIWQAWEQSFCDRKRG